MFFRFLIILFLGIFAFAKEELPDRDYLIRSGISNEDNIVSTTQLKKEITQARKKTKETQSVDYSSVIILNNIKKNRDDDNVKVKTSSDFLNLNQKYKQEKKDFVALKNKMSSQSDFKGEKKAVEKLFFLECSTFQDYKIFNDVNIKMICNDKFGKKYKLFVALNISRDKVDMQTKPYRLFDEFGKSYTVKSEKSMIYNKISGSSNLATYVDRKAFENVSKAMATTMGKEVPQMTKDYIDQKQKADTTVIQTDNGNTVSSIQETINPRPDAVDYSIKLLVDTLSSGIKAATDTLYQDLGYIYYIPKGSLFEVEAFVDVME